MIITRLAYELEIYRDPFHPQINNKHLIFHYVAFLVEFKSLQGREEIAMLWSDTLKNHSMQLSKNKNVETKRISESPMHLNYS